MPHDGTNGASTLWSEADALDPFAPPKRMTPSRHAQSEHGPWVNAFSPSYEEDFEDGRDVSLESLTTWEDEESDHAGEHEHEGEYEHEHEHEWEDESSDAYAYEDDESLSTPVAAACRCPKCHCEHEAFGGEVDETHEADDAEREGMSDPEFGGAVALAEWEHEGAPGSWATLAVPSTVFEEEDEDAEDEDTSAAQTGLSPLAKRGKLHPGHAARSSPWDKQVYGLVVHTTGGTLPGKAQSKKTPPDQYAVNYYTKSGGTHYVNGWGGVDGGQLHQVMNEKVQAQGVGKRKSEPEKDQWKSVAAGRFEADLPPIVVRLWRARWPGVKDSLSLLPVKSSANRTYVHVECVPCVYYRNGSGPLIVEPSAPPLRDGLRFTRAQHETVARLAWDIAQRHGWPPGEAWWRTPRLLGHEDITPLSRFDKNGCWDPGGLREKPYFDWPFVYSYLERLSGGVVPSLPPVAPAPSSSGTVTSLLGSIADRFRHLIQTGQEVLAISEAIRSGQTDLNKLTSLVFFARHPELGGRKLRADERELAQEWLRIRDTLVRPVLARLQAGSSAPAASTAPAAGSTSTKKPSINEGVVARIKQYARLVEAAAKKHGVEAALINGFIAAESGGNPNLVAKSGYTGLMQSEKKRSHLDPATSIDEGTQKLASFRKIMDGILRKRGHTYDGMPDVDRLQLLALAYNAGPVTVAKALQYAAEAGRPEAWREADHYKRALLFTGAYSTRQAAGTCLPKATAAEREARIKEAEAVRKKHKFKTEWRKAPDPPAWPTVGPTLPAFVQCAIDFKHRNSPRYSAKILAYRDHFRAG